jgi:hypothetical protein
VGYDMTRRHDGEYFRLNIWGMSVAREQLFAVGAINVAEMPPYPQLADFGLERYPQYQRGPAGEWKRLDLLDDEHRPLDPGPTPLEVRYLEAVEGWEQYSPPGEIGIPAYKLGSNDGWVVQWAEIESGLAFADAHHVGWRDRLDDYVREWVEWMEKSPDGFVVW